MGKIGHKRKKSKRIVHTEVPCDQWISRKQFAVKHEAKNKMRGLFGGGRARNPLLEMEFLSQPVEITATRQTSLTKYFQKQQGRQDDPPNQLDVYCDLQSSSDSDLPHILCATNHSPENQGMSGSVKHDIDYAEPDWLSPSAEYHDSANQHSIEPEFTEPHRKMNSGNITKETIKVKAGKSIEETSRQNQGKENLEIRIDHSNRQCNHNKWKLSTSIESHSSEENSPPRKHPRNRKHSRSPKNAKLSPRIDARNRPLCILDSNSPPFDNLREIGKKFSDHRKNLPVQVASGHEEVVLVSDSDASQVSKGNPAQRKRLQRSSMDLSDYVCSASSQESITAPKLFPDSHEYSSLTDEYANEDFTHTNTQKAVIRKTEVRKAVQQFALDLKLEEDRLLDKRKCAIDANTETQPLTFHVAEVSCDTRSHDEESCDIPSTFHVSNGKDDPDSSTDFHQSQADDLDSQLSDDSQFSPLTFH